jgi:hypothetical protein
MRTLSVGYPLFYLTPVHSDTPDTKEFNKCVQDESQLKSFEINFVNCKINSTIDYLLKLSSVNQNVPRIHYLVTRDI